MDELMKNIAEHSKSKRGYQFYVHGHESNIRTIYTPEVTFQSEVCDYEIALTKLETYYSFPNIQPENNNFKVSIDKGKSWKALSIPTGCYEIKAINQTIQRLIKESGGKENTIKILPNVNTLKCVLDIVDENYQIDFTVNNCLRTVLGFDAKIYTHGRYESDKLVDIMHINSILVHCDIVTGSRVNGIEAPIIYSFFPNVSPGEKIIETPKNLIYVPITTRIISSITCWLTDQDGNPLDLRGEKLDISLHIRACQ